jgi:quercetin dioxygenase-like cupin family protein
MHYRAFVHPSHSLATVGPVREALVAALLIAALMFGPLHASAAAPAAAESVTELMTRDLIGAAGKEVRMISVAYLPGGASLPRRHDAQVFVYVLEGSLVMQLRGSAAVTLGPGQTFHEGPDAVHQLSANASRATRRRFWSSW